MTKKTAPKVVEPPKPRDRIIGLDLSLTGTGVALTEASEATVKTGFLMGAKLRGVERLFWYRTKIMEWVTGPPTQTTLVVIEGYSFGSRNSQAHSLGELGGVIRLACATAGHTMVRVPPGTLKKFVTGKGNATKPEMAVGLFKRWGIEKADDNEADAAALALYGRALTGIDTPATKEQREALTACEVEEPIGVALRVRQRVA